MAKINRSKFCSIAKQYVKELIYTETDCIGFIKYCAAKAGCAISSSGTNYTWRNGLSSKGETKTATIQAGNVVFRYYNPSDNGYSLPGRYSKDPDQRDIHHIGIVVESAKGKWVVCDSRSTLKNGQTETFTSVAALAKKWPLIGELKEMQNAAVVAEEEPTVEEQVVEEIKQSTTISEDEKNEMYGVREDGWPWPSFQVSITIDNLNLREGPGTNYDKAGKAVKGQIYTIDEISNGFGYIYAKRAWVKLEKRWMKVVSGSATPVAPQTAEISEWPACQFSVKVINNRLNMRQGPGLNYKSLGYIPMGYYIIDEVANGFGYVAKKKCWIKLNTEWMTLVEG